MNSNDYRRRANQSEMMAAKWLSFAKNKDHSTNLRICAARNYRRCVREAAMYRKMAEK